MHRSACHHRDARQAPEAESLLKPKTSPARNSNNHRLEMGETLYAMRRHQRNGRVRYRKRGTGR